MFGWIGCAIIGVILLLRTSRRTSRRLTRRALGAATVLAEAGEERDEIICAELDRDLVFQARRARPNFRDRRPELYGPICMSTEDIGRIE